MSPKNHCLSGLSRSADHLPCTQFQQRLIEQGIDGGKQAAYALRNAILKQCHNSDSEIEVSARVIANLSGLSYITRASGTVDSEQTVKEFTLGFTQGMASFDFVDVGRGKERADTKIKGETFSLCKLRGSRELN